MSIEERGRLGPAGIGPRSIEDPSPTGGELRARGQSIQVSLGHLSPAGPAQRSPAASGTVPTGRAPALDHARLGLGRLSTLQRRLGATFAVMGAVAGGFSGAALGTLLCPGIGTVVGAIVGAYYGGVGAGAMGVGVGRSLGSLVQHRKGERLIHGRMAEAARALGLTDKTAGGFRKQLEEDFARNGVEAIRQGKLTRTQIVAMGLQGGVSLEDLGYGRHDVTPELADRKLAEYLRKEAAAFAPKGLSAPSAFEEALVSSLTFYSIDDRLEDADLSQGWTPERESAGSLSSSRGDPDEPAIGEERDRVDDGGQEAHRGRKGSEGGDAEFTV